MYDVEDDDIYINPIIVFFFIVISAILIVAIIINEVVRVQEYGFGFWLRLFACAFLIIVMFMYKHRAEEIDDYDK